MRLHWKKDDKETGLRSIGAPPRSSRLHDGEEHYASVCSAGFRETGPKWYWVVPRFDWMPYMNTCNARVETEQQAKDAAMAYVKHHLAQREKLKGN